MEVVCIGKNYSPCVDPGINDGLVFNNFPNIVAVPGCQIINSVTSSYTVNAAGGGDNWISDVYTYVRYSLTGACGSSACETNLRIGATGYNHGAPCVNSNGSQVRTPTIPAPNSCCNRTGCAGVSLTVDLFATKNYSSIGGAIGCGNPIGEHFITNFVVTVNTTQIPASVVTLAQTGDDV